MYIVTVLSANILFLLCSQLLYYISRPFFIICDAHYVSKGPYACAWKSHIIIWVMKNKHVITWHVNLPEAYDADFACTGSLHKTPIIYSQNRNDPTTVCCIAAQCQYVQHVNNYISEVLLKLHYYFDYSSVFVFQASTNEECLFILYTIFKQTFKFRFVEWLLQNDTFESCYKDPYTFINLQLQCNLDSLVSFLIVVIL